MDKLSLIKGLGSLSPKEAVAVINDLPFAYYRSDAEGKLVATSQAMVELFGFTDAEELIGVTISDYYTDASGRVRFMQAMERGGGKVANFEAEMWGPRGTFWVATSAQWVFDDHGTIIGVEGLTRDITKQREALLFLQRDADFFDAFARSAGIGLGIHAADGEEVFVNETMYDLIDLKPADSDGQNIYSRLSDEITTIGKATDQTVLTGGSIHQQEALITVKGQPVWRSFSKFVIRREDSATPLICTTVQDIQDRKMQEAQLLQSSKLASIGELAAGIAHEINQPLNAIRLTSANLRNHLLKSESLDAKAGLSLEKINQQIDRASNIISQLLLYGRESSSNQGGCSLQRVIDNIRALVQQTLKVENIGLTVAMPEHDMQVPCNVTRTEQVLMNLITNSRHAILERRQHLDSDTRQPGKIEITVQRLEEHAVVRVQDDGTGVPASDRNRILEPFVTSKAAGQGTGLGLSVSLGILRDAGGTLEFLDCEVGACAEIKLPLLTATSTE